MPSLSEVEGSANIPVNALSQVQERVRAGRIPWTGPLLLVVARSALWLGFQSLLALMLLVLHRPAPFRTAGNWWMLYGTLSDLCCLLGMRYFTRREGIRLRDLIGPIRMRWGRDLFLGFGILVLAWPCTIFGGYLAQILVYGSPAKTPMMFILQAHTLPLWATVYTLSIWWVIQSATEEMTYNGYALPRLEALTGHTWIAFLIVWFWFSAQHCMVPFVPDWRYVEYRFLMMAPLMMVMILVYLRLRRLSPMILAHWPMDLGIAIMTGTSLGAAWTNVSH
ncbi:MAG: CPBP family glutamic-type intramembrane protease [Terracidiphilus sp.]